MVDLSDKYLSVRDISRISDLGDDSVRKAMREGELEHVVTRLGRMATPAAVEAWLAFRRARGLAVPAGA